MIGLLKLTVLLEGDVGPTSAALEFKFHLNNIKSPFMLILSVLNDVYRASHFLFFRNVLG